jgi:hypothetical protein
MRHRPAAFDVCRKRVREITMIVIYRHRGLPDTDDREIYLVLVAHHLKPKDGDIAFALGNWVRRLGANVPERELLRISKIVATKPRRYKAATLGKMLRVTYQERCALKLTTIRCYDVSMVECARRRREERRQSAADRRRQRGAKPHANSLSRRQPWVEEGMSRRTYYRQGRHRAHLSRGTNSCAPFKKQPRTQSSQRLSSNLKRPCFRSDRAVAAKS